MTTHPSTSPPRSSSSAICRTRSARPKHGGDRRAARARGIPAGGSTPSSLVLLGHGARQRRILAAETDRTGAIAEAIAQDKELTRDLLGQVGVPVPKGRPVKDAEDAWAAAQEIGCPVVVKPQFGSQGRGVATNLSTREQVEAAYASVRADWTEVVVERFAPGADYRVLVVGGRVVAAARRDPAQVIGDGRHTIAELVALVNRDPRRGDDHATVLSKIVLDPIALDVLAEQGYTPESVPRPGHRVLIRRNANLSTGGTATDVTDRVHPEVAARSVEAARIIGLDVAGVDVIAQDISRPLEEQAGVIVEVNAAPGLADAPGALRGNAAGGGRGDRLAPLPEGETGRMPIVAVTGVNGKTTTTRLIAQIVRQTGKTVGMTCTDGIWIGDRWIDRAIAAARRAPAWSCSTRGRGGRARDGARRHPPRGPRLRSLRRRRGDQHRRGRPPRHGRRSTRSRSWPWSSGPSSTSCRPTGAAVLNAADPLVAEMAPKCPGSVVFFARDAERPGPRRPSGVRRPGVFVRDEAVVLAEGDEETVLVSLDRVPLTHQGRIDFQVENVLAASAAAWSLGLPSQAIADVLEVFTSDIQQTPGRFNVLDHGEATIVLDYGHNSSALLALVEAIAVFPHKRRLTVFTAAGDRRDEDIVRQGEIIGEHFDFIILYEDACLRGRPDGEVTALLRQGLSRGDRLSGSYETRGELGPSKPRSGGSGPGDLLYIQPDQVELCLGFVQNYLATHAPVVGRDRVAEGSGLIIAV